VQAAISKIEEREKLTCRTDAFEIPHAKGLAYEKAANRPKPRGV